MSGEVADHGVRIGTFEFAVRGLPSDDRFQSFRRRVMRDASAAVFVTIDEQLAGAIVMEDTVRPEAARVLREVKRHGIHETVMVTGDDPAVATAVGHALGLDRVLSALSPADKVAAVREAAKTMPTLMVGDGINDAPALAAAGVGIAMGAAGATASSEAADAVIMVDRLDRVVDALDIARRSRGIALQSVLVGMGLSMVAMGFAAAGFLPPVQGAILQEGIDLLAILIALRAATGRLGPGRAPAIDERLAVQLREDHRHLRGALGLIREVGDQIDELAPAEAVDRLHEVSAFLDMIVEHERNDEWVVLPSIARAVGGDDPLAAISRTHQEVFQLTGSFNRLVADIAASGLEPEDLTDIRRLLYSLSALLELNIAQEEDLYATLHDEYFELSVPAAS